MSSNLKKNEYEVTILSKPRILKRCTPLRLSNDKNDEAYNERAYEVPITPLSFQVSKNFREKHEHEKQHFDDHRIILPNQMTLLNFKENSKAVFKDLGSNKAYDKLSLQLFNKNYSKLIHEIKTEYLTEFDKAFNNLEIDLYFRISHPMISYPLVCSSNDLKTFEKLATQGHIYSQVIVGILLSCKGNVSKGIEYLLEAYNNRFTIALSFITEFLIMKEDWIGAIQCALLTYDIDPGYYFLIDQIVAHTTNQLIDTNKIGDGTIPATPFGSGFMPLMYFIVHYVLNSDFQKIAKKYNPKWLPTQTEKEEEMRQFFNRRHSLETNNSDSY